MTATTNETTSLRALVDRAEITALFDRFFVTLDTHDEATHDDDWYRTLFTEDVRLRFPIGGHDGVTGCADLETRAKGNWERTHHVGANYVMDIDGDHATLRAQVLATHVHFPSGNGPRPHFAMGGSYDAEAVRTGDGWRFRLVALHVVWTSGEPLTPDLGKAEVLH